MLKDDIREAIKTAMRAQDKVARSILKVALGEIDTVEKRQGEDLPDADAITIVRKLVKSNEQTIEASSDDATKALLARENEILETLLPQALGVDAIVVALTDVTEAIQGAKADGPAMGVAMKTLKASGAVVESQAVAEAVRRIRSGA